MNILNTGVIFTPIAFIICGKKWGPSGPGAMNFDIPKIARSIKQILICPETKTS